MNQIDWVSLAVFVAVCAASYWASETLKLRVVTMVQPLLGKIVPVFRMEPWLFESIAVDDLPKKQRRHFETNTPGFLARGFMPVGDFVLRRDPQPSCVRYFLSPDGTVIGGINCYLGQRGIECMSVLLDGFYLETGTGSCSQLPPAEHGLQFSFLNTDDSVALIVHHTDWVAKIAADRGTQPAPLEAGDVTAAANYGRELALKSLKQQGMLSELPQFLQRKSRESEVESAV